MTLFPEYILVIFLGLVLGSFATALIYRVPRSVPWYGLREQNRSACPQCKTLLKLPDLVPVFSWLAGRGKCRSCKQPISVVYPLTEILVLLACLGVYWSWGLTPAAGVFMLCIPFLVALLVIDLQLMILPTQLVWIAGGLGLVRLVTEYLSGNTIIMDSILPEYIMGGVAYGVFAWVLGFAMSWALKKEALGGGDVKFFAVAGLWLGLSQLGWFCLLAGGLGIVLALGWKILKKGEVFPFGPALILSLYLLLILGGSLFP